MNQGAVVENSAINRPELLSNIQNRNEIEDTNLHSTASQETNFRKHFYGKVGLKLTMSGGGGGLEDSYLQRVMFESHNSLEVDTCCRRVIDIDKCVKVALRGDSLNSQIRWRLYRLVSGVEPAFISNVPIVSKYKTQSFMNLVETVRTLGFMKRYSNDGGGADLPLPISTDLVLFELLTNAYILSPKNDKSYYSSCSIYEHHMRNWSISYNHCRFTFIFKHVCRIIVSLFHNQYSMNETAISVNLKSDRMEQVHLSIANADLSDIFWICHDMSSILNQFYSDMTSSDKDGDTCESVMDRCYDILLFKLKRSNMTHKCYTQMELLNCFPRLTIRKKSLSQVSPKCTTSYEEDMICPFPIRYWMSTAFSTLFPCIDATHMKKLPVLIDKIFLSKSVMILVHIGVAIVEQIAKSDILTTHIGNNQVRPIIPEEIKRDIKQVSYLHGIFKKHPNSET